jgi:hypothetical protein
MPKNVRNFWIEIEVDGNKSKVATGPISKDGGFSCIILMRENGKISENSIHIVGENNGNQNFIKGSMKKDGKETKRLFSFSMER